MISGEVAYRGSAGEDVFAHLLSIVLPNGGLIVAMDAFFDESQTRRGILSVAGLGLFDHTAFDKAWKGLYGDRVLRMSKLNARQGDFEGLEPEEVERLVNESVEIVNREMAVGFVTTCILSEYDGVKPKGLPGFGHAYGLCCYVCIASMGDWLDDQGLKDEKVAFFFENGYRARGTANGLILNLDHRTRRLCHYKAHSFIGKEDAVPLQAADMLAWEAAKFYDESYLQRTLVPRESFGELLKPGKIRAYNLTGAELREQMARAKEQLSTPTSKSKAHR